MFRALAIFGVFICAINAAADDACARIISLAPSITETLFALDLGTSIVGRTRYCKYPPEAKNIPEVGGFLDTNLELIAATKPTIAMLLKEQSDLAGKLSALSIPTVVVDQRSVSGIFESISAIGSACKIETKAANLKEKLESEVTEIKHRFGALPIRKALVSVGRVAENGRLASVFVAGSDGFYTDLLRLAGGINANQGTTVSLPTVSPEGILALKPDVIFEIETEPGSKGLSDDDLIKLWHTIPGLSGVRVFVFRDDYAGIPGPRFTKLLLEFAKRLHPEIAELK